MSKVQITKGLILKINDTPGKDRVLKILTCDGLISAFMKTKRTAGKTSYIADLFTYGEFSLFKTDKGNYLVNSFTPESHYFALCDDIVKLSAAGYFASLVNTFDNEPDVDYLGMLNLLRSAFDALIKKDADVKLIKSIFEIKVSQLIGIEPCLEADNKAANYYFDFNDGRLYANEIRGGVYISRNTVLFIYNTLKSQVSSVFDLKCDDTSTLGALCEHYLMYHIDRSPDSLEFLKGVM